MLLLGLAFRLLRETGREKQTSLFALGAGGKSTISPPNINDTISLIIDMFLPLKSIVSHQNFVFSLPVAVQWNFVGRNLRVGYMLYVSISFPHVLVPKFLSYRVWFF